MYMGIEWSDEVEEREDLEKKRDWLKKGSEEA